MDYVTPHETIIANAARMRKTFDSGITRDTAYRKAQLRGILRFLAEEENAIVDAVYSDIRRPRMETIVVDIGMVVKDAKAFLKQLDSLVKPTFPHARLWGLIKGSGSIRKEPKGVVLVIGTWNYAIQTSLLPVVCAIAAGNTVILKPSELAPNVAQLLADKLHHYVDEACVCVVQGAVKEATLLLEQEVDHIFYTGNSQVGRIIMTAAAKQLIPVTLELGGKSQVSGPTLVLPDADVDVAAQRIVWGKFVNAGQTCIAPDYVVVTDANAQSLVDSLKKAVQTFYGTDPQASSSYARIVNSTHFDRIVGLLENIPSDNIVLGGQTDRADLYIAPTLVLMSTDDTNNPLMKQEIFGPILPVWVVPTVNEMVSFVKRKDTPLALYVFSQDRVAVDALLDKIPSGGVCVNDTLMHTGDNTLPFGGKGNSGVGAYHGKHGFDTLSHHRATMQVTTSGERAMTLRYPPYNDAKLSIMHTVIWGIPTAPNHAYRVIKQLVSALWTISFATPTTTKGTDKY